MRISIVVASLNPGAMLQRCLDSIAQQHHGDTDVVVDGDSRDGTRDLLQRWKGGENIRFQWLSEPDSGIADAWNKASARTSGEWVLFLGADDVLAGPRVLARTSSLLTAMKPPNRVVYGQVAW